MPPPPPPTHPHPLGWSWSPLQPFQSSQGFFGIPPLVNITALLLDALASPQSPPPPWSYPSSLLSSARPFPFQGFGLFRMDDWMDACTCKSALVAIVASVGILRWFFGDLNVFYVDCLVLVEIPSVLSDCRGVLQHARLFTIILTHYLPFLLIINWGFFAREASRAPSLPTPLIHTRFDF